MSKYTLRELQRLSTQFNVPLKSLMKKKNKKAVDNLIIKRSINKKLSLDEFLTIVDKAGLNDKIFKNTCYNLEC